MSDDSNILRFRHVPAGSNSANAAKFLRELADMCDDGKVEALAVFYETEDPCGGENLHHFHDLFGKHSSIIYAMEAAKISWIGQVIGGEE